MSNIRIERDGAVGSLTIDRPARFNALDVETARDFRRAGLELARDRALRAVVLRGVDGIFCSGADLKYIRSGGDAAGLEYLRPDLAAGAAPAVAARTAGNAESATGYGRVFKQILEYIHSTLSEIRRSPTPWIAAVDGVAAAGGFGIAMCCDLVVASERAVFEWAYGKSALTGAESSTFLLPRLVGFHKAMEIALLNPRLSAAEAKDLGLVNRVFPVAGFDDAVRGIAATVAAGPSTSFGITKGLLNRAAGLDRLDVHLDLEISELARIADSADFAEGLDAFFGKRPAAFGGKG